jgi:hypothetical protein
VFLLRGSVAQRYRSRSPVRSRSLKDNPSVASVVATIVAKSAGAELHVNDGGRGGEISAAEVQAFFGRRAGSWRLYRRIAHGIFAVARTSRSSASEDDFVVVGFFGFNTKSTKHERIFPLN